MVKDIQKRHLRRRFHQPRLRQLKPIAFDEVAVGKGHRHFTIVMDLDADRVVFIGRGKGGDALIPFWKRLRSSGAKVAAVATDPSSAYLSAVMTHLPKARHVADPFHIVKLTNEKLSDLRRDLHRECVELLDAKVLKWTRWLSLKNPENVDAAKNEPSRLQAALGLNRPLALAY